MKIAIAADAPGIDSNVAVEGARAAFYLIFDEDDRLLAALANPLAAGGRHAGPAAVQFLAAQGVELVAAGEFGPNFIDALAEQGIGHVQESGPVADVIARVKARRGTQ